MLVIRIYVILSEKRSKGDFMKKSSILLLGMVSLLLLTACGEEEQERASKKIENPVDTYMDSRVNAMDMAKQSVKDSNKKVEEQDKAMKALLGK